MKLCLMRESVGMPYEQRCHQEKSAVPGEKSAVPGEASTLVY